MLEPLGRLPRTTVWVVPSGRTSVPLALSAALGPLLLKVTVAVIVLPGVPCALALSVTATSASGVRAVLATAVLFARVVSGVLVATVLVASSTDPLAGTVVVKVCVTLAPGARSPRL